MRTTWLAGVLTVLMALTGACSSGDGDSEGSAANSSTTTEDRAAATDDGDTDDGTDGGANGGSGSAGLDTGDGNGSAGGDGDGSGPSAGSDANGSRVVLTSEEICRLLPPERVAGALGVDSVAAGPGTSSTPQCSYAFTTDDGIHTDVTVAALRPDEDLDGTEGAAAFDRVIQRNRDAAGGAEVTETTVAVGDQARLLSTSNIHFGVVQFDWRIVTTIVSAEVADTAEATALTRLTDVLAPT